MPLPKSVEVGGVKFRIQRTPKAKGDEDFGEIDTDRRVIYINPSVCKTQKAEWLTLKHEVAHAALHVSGIGYVLKHKDEEALVRMLEHIMIPSLEKLTLLEHS
jgi:Zn-dependent peptidase ImmA (M78 family)|tara:strand:+ start:1311 stop:1619 length:309 start_codon:yes stop_codon:yes gene_type:complete